ncbi:MAG: heavy-metal-associated domain-containing protein [Bacteroidota bacterium]
MKKLLIITALIASMTTTAAPPDTVVIQTSAVCGTCKKTIERDLSFEKGVESSELELETKKLTVVYDAHKTDADKIRKRVARIGYDADDVQKNMKGFNRLPDCCKKACSSH